MMINENTKDHLFEALFRQAVIDNYEEELSMIPSEDELSKQYLFSDLHIAQMKRLFLQAERRERLQAVTKWARRCAAVIIAGTLILFGALMTVPEVRATVTSVIVEWFEQFTKFTSEQDSPQELQEWEPSYLPEGFAEDERYGDFGRGTIRYSDSQGNRIAFTYVAQDDSVSVDNENRHYYEVNEAGTLYHVFKSETPDKLSTVVWDQEEYRFSVDGQISGIELLNIAKSIRKIY